MIRPCGNPTCPEPAVYRGYCQRHAKQRNQDRNRTRVDQRKVYLSKRWKLLRRKFLFANPLCAECGRVASDVHHITDIADGGDPWDWAGLQGLCRRCHSRITRAKINSAA